MLTYSSLFWELFPESLICARFQHTLDTSSNIKLHKELILGNLGRSLALASTLPLSIWETNNLFIRKVREETTEIISLFV